MLLVGLKIDKSKEKRLYHHFQVVSRTSLALEMAQRNPLVHLLVTTEVDNPTSAHDQAMLHVLSKPRVILNYAIASATRDITSLSLFISLVYPYQ